jgi:hypothetical protein
MGACLSSPESKGGDAIAHSAPKGPSPDKSFKYTAAAEKPKHLVSSGL